MARKKPNSGKAKKTELQTHRAVKARTTVRTPHPLDAEEFALRQSTSARLEIPASSRPSGVQRFRTVEENSRDSRKEASLKMESRFLRLPLDLLQHHRLISATSPLIRPIPEPLGVLRVDELQPEELEGLTCPRRPKWSFNSTKLEVEKNEEGLFSKWLKTTDDLLQTFAASLPSTPAPSFFERNLQVWRQLWRVSEASSILLILIDVRFPLIHYPPSLEAYVKGLRPAKKVILVLTKTDLVPRWLSEAWKTWFEEREGPDGASVVLMESYRETERTVLTQGTQPRFLPAAPTSARIALLTALKKAHQELIIPPPIIAEDPARLARWSPKHRVSVDWDSVVAEPPPPTAEKPVKEKKEKKTRRNKDKDVYIPRKKKPLPGEEAAEEEEEEEEEVEVEPEVEETPAAEKVGDDAFPFITVGLIGQPNVGKSSLLNALIGRKVVKASRTPGKTKTLQTIFWNSTVRLADCPGLVCPSFAGMERQVLSGILPIQNVEPVLYFIAQRMPLERILKLRHPDEDDFSLEEEGPKWTADELLSTYALNQGFITAKAGRPDLYRGGAYILRQLHSSAIPWGFRPPFAGDASAQDQEGIYIPRFVAKSSTATQLAREKKLAQEDREGKEEEEENRDRDSQDTGSSNEEESEEVEEESEEEESDQEDRRAATAVLSAFAALGVEEGEDDSDEAEE